MLTILYVVIVAGFLSAVVYYPKIEGRINGVKAFVVGSMSILCYQTLTAWLLDKLQINVGIVSVGLLMLLPTALLWGIIWKKRRIQKLFWRWTDAVAILILFVFVWLISMRVTGIFATLQYSSVESAQNLYEAMKVVRGGSLVEFDIFRVSTVLLIEMLGPFLPTALAFKGFVLAEVLLHMLEAALMYVLIITISEKKLVRLLAPVLCIAYFWGYPAYNYMVSNYTFWSSGAMLLIFTLYALVLLEKRSGGFGSALVLLILGMAAGMCGGEPSELSGIVAGALAILLVLQRTKKRFMERSAFYCMIATSSMIAVTGLAGFYRTLAQTTGDGQIYSSMYADLVFLLPALFYVCYYVLFKRKPITAVATVSIAMICFTVALYVLWYNSRITNFDYYKIYYSLWVLGWILVAQALAIAVDTEELSVFFSYMGMVLVLALVVLSDYDDKMMEHYIYDDKGVTKNFFSLYRYNADVLLEDATDYVLPEDALRVYDYVNEQCGGEEIPILTEDVISELRYDALTANDSASYSLTVHGFPDVLELLEQTGIEKVVVLKGQAEYELYGEYFAGCPVLYENEAAALYAIPGDTWTDVYNLGTPEYKERVQLYSYVKQTLSDEQVPLMARKASYMDFIVYKDLTGNDATDYYTWNYGERENIENLNRHGVQCVVLLKDDDYYKANHAYYEGQVVLFENGAGMVVQCVGDEWFLAN